MPAGKGADPERGLSRTDVLTGTTVLIGAQLAAASTASCVKALPPETPSMLRGLWRQTLTTFIFSAFALILRLSERRRARRRDARRSSMNSEGEDSVELNEETALLIQTSETASSEEDGEDLDFVHMHRALPRGYLVALTVFGATLLNDTIVVALRYASSAAVMCLCNTTPIWLILYAIINCRAETPGLVTIIGASLSLFGTIVCSTGESNGGADHENEKLGAIIATTGAIGGAIYMTACRKLAPCGLHPVHLSLIINVGMMFTTFLLCATTLPQGVAFFSTDITVGFWGFVNPDANPAAVLHSIFPDLGGNFGIMLALRYFEPLIVSLVMLTEPLNASIIAMYAVHEAPPSGRTIFGVGVVLVGCAIVLWESKKDAKELDSKEEAALEAIFEEEEEKEEGYGAAMQIARRKSIASRRRRSTLVVYSGLEKYAPPIHIVVADHDIEERRTTKRQSVPIAALKSSITKLERGGGIHKFRSSRV